MSLDVVKVRCLSVGKSSWHVLDAKSGAEKRPPQNNSLSRHHHPNSLASLFPAKSI